MIWSLFRRPARGDAAAGDDPYRDGVQIPPTAGPDDAERRLRAAIQSAPDSAVPHVQLGVLLARSGRLDEAVPYFERGVALDPDNVFARTNLANVYRQVTPANNCPFRNHW
jgi:predicted Zn-dependent protease